MPIYEVDLGGKTYEVDAPDPKTAWSYASYSASQQPSTAPAKPAATTEPGLPSLAGPKQDEMKAFEPSALEELQNVGRRGLLQAKQTQNTLAFQAGLIDPATYAEKTRENERLMGAAAPSGDVAAGLERLQAANATGGYGNVISELTKLKNLKALGSLVGESAIATGETIPVTIAGGLTGGPTGAAAATGLVSFGMEYGSAMADLLNEKGIDPSNTLAVRNAIEDPAFLAAAQERGIKRGIPVAAFDALSAGFAGRFINNLERAVANNVISGKAIPKAMAVAAGKEAGLQVGAGMGGEATAQAVTGENKPLDVLLEGIAELPGGISEVATNVRNARQQAAPAVAAEEPARAKYERPSADQGLEALARAKGFLTPEQATPAAPEAAQPEVNLDREAELRDLLEQTARAEGVTPPTKQPDYNKLESTVAEAQQPVAEAPVVEPVVEEVPVEVEQPKAVQPAPPVSKAQADLSLRAQQYDTPDLRLQQSDAFGTDLTTELYAEMESHGRAALKNRSLTDGYAKKKEALADAADAATIAFGAKDYSVFAPYAQTFPKLAKQLKSHLATTEQKATPPVAAEKLEPAPEYGTPEYGKLTPEEILRRLEAQQAAAMATPTPVPAKKVAKETPLRKASYAKNPFMTFLADKGLYHVKGKPNSLKSEFSKDKQIPVSGHGFVFRASGKQLDELLPLAIQDGYLPPDATEPQLYSLVQKAIAGQKVEPVYSAQGVENTAAKYEERMAEEEPVYEERAGQSDAEWHGMSEADYIEMMSREVAAISDDEFAELAEAVGDFKYTPPSNASVRAAMEALGFTEEEIQNEERRTAAKAPEAVAGEPSKGNEPSEAAPTLELETQTAEELKSKQDEIDRLTKENERLAKQAESKAKADAERDEFVLTGSDRAADVAAAQGQKDIFGAMEEESPAEEQFTPLKGEDGKPVVVYRGSLGTEQDTFAPTNFFGSGFFGKGINLTSSPDDASKYASTDAEVNIDLPGRASVMAEALGIDYNEAKAELTKNGGKVYPLLVSLNNPLVIGKKKLAVPENVLRLALAESNFKGSDADIDRFVRQFNKAADGVAQFEVVVNNKASTVYRQIASLQNKDGLIIEPEVAPKGKGATHYLVFDKDQVKSVFEVALPKQQPKAPVKAEKPEVASEVVGPAEKPAAPKLTREPVTIEGQFTEVGEEKQRALVTTQTKKLSDAQVSTLEKFYGFARDTEEFANAARQDILNFINKGATYVNGKIRAIIRSMANGLLSVAVAFNPQFVSMPYTIAVPQYETRIEQVMQEVPASVQKQMSEDAKRAYATIYPAIKGELQSSDKFFIVADKQTANVFVFNPDGSPFMNSKTLFAAGIGDFIKGDNNIVSNRITPAGLFDLGLRDAKRSVDEAHTAGEYDFGKVFVLDKSQKGANGFYSTTIMHSVWTKEADAKQRLAALQKPGAEDSRYSFGCINVDKETYGKLVTNNLAQMDGAKIFIVPENGTDVMSFVNGEATYRTDIIRQRAEPVTKETKQEVQRAAQTAETERSVVGKEEEGLLYNDLFTRSVTSEEKKRSPSFKRRMDKLNRDRLNGKITDEAFINETDWALKQAENERHSKGVAERVRGADFIRQKLLEAKRKGDLSPEAVDLAEWFIRNNEQLVEDLGVSVRSPSASGVGGQYSTMSRIIILMKDAGSDVTVVHEILHHLERMMPPKVQQAIRDAWAKQLLAAQKKAKAPAEKLYFNALINAHYGNNDLRFLDAEEGEMSKVFMKALAEMDFDSPGNKSAMKLAETLLKMGAVPYQNYQYFNPSEFWAVNGADIVQGRFNAVQGGVLARLKNWLKELAQKIKGMFGLNSDAAILKALDSLSKGDGQFVTQDMLGEGDYKNLHRNYRGGDAPDSAWTSMDENKLDTAIYNLADKHIDTKRVIENIRKTSGDIAEDWDAYTKEELYHGRTAKAINDFLDNEMLPITKEMKANKVTLDELDEYLHNRHAEERNIQINRINPDPKLKDRGSGIATKDAVKYLSELSPERAQIFESLAAQVDSIVTKTQDILVKSGMETQQTINDWNNAYEHYVPLQRDDLEYVHTGSGISGGYATRGKTAKRATGSLKSVVDIFENIAIQRERAVMKAERARVGRALYGLAIKYPNPEFWLPVNPDAIKNKGDLIKELVSMGLSPADADSLFQEPTVSDIDKKTGTVKYVINQNNRYSENVFPIRINGQDRFIIFNGSDPRAERMVRAMKNLDADQLGVVVGAIGEVTRFLASVNTQYNPVFGAWNFLRDVQGAALNLSTTELAGHEKQVLAGVSPTKGMPALRAIYRDLRGKGATTTEMQEWIDLFEDYQKAGGATGYKDQFSKGRDAPGIVERELKKLDRGNARKAADVVFNWLSDYNDAMENAVRLSAYKVAVQPVSEGGLGLSKDKAASIAKNLTVNFNRKGAASPTFQALYAFFNASVQGTARLAETLRGPAGRKIMAGGFMIGVAQAIALAMAGFDDDDPPEFLKNKNLIIPTDWLGTEGGNYLIVPMPMGFSMFPGIGRLTTEYLLGKGGMITGAKGVGDKIASAASLILDSFNPLGSGSFLQMAAPTAADPLVAIATNRDAFGRPIAKEDRATSPTPGYTRSRENATWISKQLAEFLNYVSSPMGTKYTKGAISPTADQLDYLAGQVGGGVSRELIKTGEYLSAWVKGETSETPSYRVPIVGKMYGETETPAAISSKFYQNVTLLAEMENEIKSRQKNREDTKEYRAENPESRLINRANYLENQITALHKQKKLLQEKDAPAERIKKIDEQKTKLMKGLNDQIKKIQQ
jgi:hypothetical protein